MQSVMGIDILFCNAMSEYEDPRDITSKRLIVAQASMQPLL